MACSGAVQALSGCCRCSGPWCARPHTHAFRRPGHVRAFGRRSCPRWAARSSRPRLHKTSPRRRPIRLRGMADRPTRPATRNVVPVRNGFSGRSKPDGRGRRLALNSVGTAALFAGFNGSPPARRASPLRHRCQRTESGPEPLRHAASQVAFSDSGRTDGGTTIVGSSMDGEGSAP